MRVHTVIHGRHMKRSDPTLYARYRLSMFDGAAVSDPMPLGTAIGLGLLLMATGALLAWVASRSRKGTLSRNWIVGIRTSATLASDEAWDAAHRAGARALSIGGWGTLATGGLLLLRPSNGIGLTVISAGLVWLLAWVFRAGYLGNRAVRNDPK